MEQNPFAGEVVLALFRPLAIEIATGMATRGVGVGMCTGAEGNAKHCTDPRLSQK